MAVMTAQDEARPDEAVAQAEALIAAGQMADALLHLTAACHRHPANPDLLRLNARVLRRLGARDAALGALLLALELGADDLGLRAELASALIDAGAPDAAIAHAEAAFRFRPTGASAALLSCALIESGANGPALDAANAGLNVDRRCPELWVNRSVALEALGRPAEAIAAARAALRTAPGRADIQHHLAAALLADGQLTPEAWTHYEARLRLPTQHPIPDGIAWTGKRFDNRTLLIHAEQGLGDTLHFVRYVPLAAARGGRVVLAVQPPLVRLLHDTPGADCVVPTGAALPPFDLVVPLLSLPGLLGTTLATIPPPLPYRHPRRSARDPGTAPRIGLAWAGSPSFVEDRKRSLPPEALAPLLAIPRARFVSLQFGATPPPGVEDGLVGVTDFAGTAACVAGLDLVIAADTAVAHLAATMGVPTWLLARHRGCWRWLHGRDDTPWYPAMRILRQPEPGDWLSVTTQAAAELRRLLEQDRHQRQHQQPRHHPVEHPHPACV